MQSRYLGSDSGLAMIDEAQKTTTAVALQAAAQSSQSVQNYLDTNIQNGQRLLQLENQKSAAEASKPIDNGLSTLANAGVSYLLNAKKQDDANAQIKFDQQKQVQAEKAKADKQALAEQRIRNAADAESKLNDLTRTYYGKGEFTSSDVSQYKDAAVRLIAQYDLEPDEMRKILSSVNSVGEERAKVQQGKIAEGIEKVQAGLAGVEEQKLSISLTGLYSNISKAGVTEQAGVYTTQAYEIVDQFMKADNGVPYDRKLAIAAGVLKNVQERYQIKSDNYEESGRKISNFQKYAQGYAVAYTQYTQDRDLNKFKGSQEQLKLQFGDYSSGVAGLGESEALVEKQLAYTQRLDKAREDAGVKAGAVYQFSDSFSNSVAVNIINNPAYAEKILADPSLKNHPSVVAGIKRAELWREFTKDRAALSTTLAGSNVDIAKLNLTNANNFASFIKASATSYKDKTITPAQQQVFEGLAQAAANNPELAAVFASAQQGQVKVTDPKIIQQGLDLQKDSISAVQDSIRQQQQAAEAQFNTKYAELRQAGLFTTDTKKIAEIGKRNEAKYNAEIDTFEKTINQAQEEAVPAYGQQPNFNGTSGFAPVLDASGRVSVAPRSSLQVIQQDGQQIVTPVVKGASAPVTDRYGAPRPKGRTHAGVDFALDGTEKAAALVGGTVVHVGSHSGYGGTIDILGDNGYVYRYAHQQPIVKEGMRISAGQAISYANGSGTNIGGNHLHFEVHKKAVYDNGKYVPQFGTGNTIDPLPHLAQLNSGASNVTKPRSGASQKALRVNPGYRAPANAFITPNGGAVQANYFQIPGQPMREATSVYNNQRPLSKGGMSWSTNKSYVPDKNDDFGYGEVRSNSKLRNKIHDAAAKLGVPGYWIADIIRQESGAFNHKATHDGAHYGLFGFGSDSFNDVSLSQIRKMDASQQIDLYVRYMKENGWDKVREKKQGNVTIAELWSISRMGVNMRNRVLADPVGTLDMDLRDPGTKSSWRYELNLLGKWAGRKYDLPGGSSNPRAKRSAAISNMELGSCPTCQSLVASGSYLAHQHDDIG